MTVFVQGLLIAALLLFIILVGAFDFGGETSKGIIFAGAGLIVLALILYLDWREGRL